MTRRQDCITARLTALPAAVRRLRLGAASLGLLTLAGCSLDNTQLPPSVTDPAITKTHDGALEAYQGVIVAFRRAFGGRPKDDNGGSAPFVAISGELTDELQNGFAAAGGSGLDQGGDAVDLRDFSKSRTSAYGSTDNVYSGLQRVRGQASQTIGLLTDYAPDLPALRGHAYALAGYAEIFLAEFFCSGVPLSTIDYNGDYTFAPGTSTADVFTHAAALFDSTLKYAGDSASIMNLARLGKARALLGKGDFVQAAATVGTVPDGYVYAVRYGTTFTTADPNQSNLTDYPQNFLNPESGNTLQGWLFSVANTEGFRGLDYISSGDPRTAVIHVNSSYQPANYSSDGSTPIVLASGVEARLIEAEAALRQNDPAWLDKLNALRTNGSTIPHTIADTLGVTGCGPDSGHLCGADGVSGGHFQVPSGYTLTDSVTIKPVPADLQQICSTMSSYAPCVSGDSTIVRRYSGTIPAAGTGGFNGLAELADPGTDSARVALLFHERAFWLFLTGHREGDLRRQLRQYSQYWPAQDRLYPIGPYPVAGQRYGNAIYAPIPDTERLNPNFTGCLSTGP